MMYVSNSPSQWYRGLFMPWTIKQVLHFDFSQNKLEAIAKTMVGCFFNLKGGRGTVHFIRCPIMITSNCTSNFGVLLVCFLSFGKCTITFEYWFRSFNLSSISVGYMHAREGNLHHIKSGIHTLSYIGDINRPMADVHHISNTIYFGTLWQDYVHIFD